MSDDSTVSAPLDIIAKYESLGGQNIKNPLSSAGGPYQMLDSTWREQAAKAGIDTAKFPTAMSAPVEIQRGVAQQLYNEKGYAPWAPYNPLLAKAVGWTGPTYDSNAAARARLGAPSSTADIASIAAQLKQPQSSLPATAVADVSAASADTSLTSAAPTSMPNAMAMMALMNAGTHKFVPITYDPFKALPEPASHATALPVAPNVTAAAPQVALPAERTLKGPAPYKLASIGGKSPGNLGLDPEVQNMLAGIA